MIRGTKVTLAETIHEEISLVEGDVHDSKNDVLVIDKLSDDMRFGQEEDAFKYEIDPSPVTPYRPLL